MKGSVLDVEKTYIFCCALTGTRVAILKETFGQLLLSNLTAFDVIKNLTIKISFSGYSFTT